MNELPPSVKNALEKIRQTHKHYVDIKVINGRCYVYESTSLWDKKLKQIKKLTKYIGRITEQGEFIASNPRNPKLSAAIATEGLAGAGSEGARKTDAEVSQEEQKAGKYDIKILRELSADGRITLPQLGKKIGLSAGGAEWHRNNIEKKYGVRYLAEIDLDKLGYLTYVIMIKFVDKIPPINEIKRDLSQEKSIQLALFMQGEYDLIIYMVLSKYGDTVWEFYNLRSRIFANYDLKLYVAPFYPTYSFVPLRDSFFDVLSERVFVRSAQQPRAQSDHILRREYVVLKELNKNGAMDFTKIDSKYDLPEGSARYTYHKLVDSGTIKRITISMENIHLKYVSMILLEKINHAKYVKARESVMRHIIEERGDEITNRYALEGDIKLPEGVFFVLPVLNEKDMESSNDSLRKIVGTQMVSMIATNILVGTLCYRRLDRRNTIQYKILKDEYGLKEEALERSEGEGTKKLDDIDL